MCPTCDKLRAEIRELREELAEWRNGPELTDDGRVHIMAQKLNSWPQVCFLIDALMSAENRVVNFEYLSELIGYEGRDGEFIKRGYTETDRKNHLKVIVSKARRALEDVGIYDAIGNVRGVGYMMPKSKAEAVRRLMED